MKLKRILTGVIASALLASAFIIPASALEVPANEFTEFIDAAGGADGGTTYLTKAGEPTYTYVDGKGVMVSDRVNSWDSVDFKLGSLNTGTEYTLVVKMSADTSATFSISDADSPYGTYVTQDGTSATLTYTFTTADAKDGDYVKAGTDNSQNRFRLNCTEGTDYYIESISITAAGEAAAEVPATTEAPAVAETPAATTAAAATTTPAKGSPNTGVAGVAAVVALAAIAGGAVVISKKK